MSTHFTKFRNFKVVWFLIPIFFNSLSWEQRSLTFCKLDHFLEYENELTMNRTSLVWKKVYPECQKFCEDNFQSVPGLKLVVKFVKETSRCECFHAAILYKPPEGEVLKRGFYAVQGELKQIIIQKLIILQEPAIKLETQVKLSKKGYICIFL